MVTTSHLVVMATHPIQYHAPVYQELQQTFGVNVTAIYGSDFSVAGYRDPEFGASVKWDSDLLGGYTSHFLEQVATGGASSTEAVTGKGIGGVLKKVRPTAILLTGYQGAFHRRAWLAALQMKVPLLFRAETNDTAIQRGRLKQWGRDLILRWLYGRCAALLPIGVQSRRHYERLAPHRPMFPAPYCVDTTPFQTDESAREQWRDVTRARLGLTSEKIAILFSGKLVPKKDPLRLVQAVKQIPETLRSKLVILFLGDGELQAQIEAEATLSPLVAVRFLGFQNQSALSPYYHAADLLVLPSAFGETWGLVVNEAFHHGLPAIVSDKVGSAPDLIETGKTGAIFPAGSATGLANAIQQLIPLLGQAETRTVCRQKVSAYTVPKAAAGIATAFGYVTKGQG